MLNREFIFQPSKTYIGLQFVVMVCCLSVISLLPVHLLLRIFTASALVVYTLYITRRHGFLRAPDSIRVLTKLDAERWQIRTLTRQFEGTLLKDSAISRWVSVLRFKVSGQRAPYVCIIWSDALPKDEYRQLVVEMTL